MSESRITPALVTAFLVAAVGYPIARVFRLNVVEFSGEHGWWWTFLANVIIGHWSAFAAIVWAMHRAGWTWSDVGVDFSWFLRHKNWMIGSLTVVLIGVFLAPGFPPETVPSGIKRLLPHTATEKLAWIPLSVTAGVVEEVIFRGFTFALLVRLMGTVWLALPVSALLFTFLHGWPPNAMAFWSYFGTGMVFGLVYIALRQRRLEYLIMFHTLYDAFLVWALAS